MTRITHAGYTAVLVIFAIASSSSPLHADPIISEFLAANASGLTDEDGSLSDWIEIKNPSDVPFSLDGYYLTDDPLDPAKWMFPDVTLGPNEHLVVFASRKNRAVAGAELHTNFSLDRDGEYLGLIRPDGVTVLSEFGPNYPEQFPDVSYGIGPVGTVEVISPLLPDADCTWFVPSEAPAEDWRVPGFDDSAWNAGKTGLGYGYAGLIGTGGDTRSAMQGVNGSVFIRIPFQIADPDAVVRLIMRLKFEDGFVAYLNGNEVASENAPIPLAYNSLATASNPDSQAEVYKSFDLNFPGKLVAGTNILAIHGMNSTLGSSDVLFLPELLAETSDPDQPEQEAFFESPTPGLPNSQGKGPAEPVLFSEASQTFTNTLQLTLSAQSPNAVIRYTTDQSIPSGDLDNPSTEYTGPITISQTTQVRARVFVPGNLDGPIRTETFINLAANLQDFSSDLPLVVIDSLGTGQPPGSGATNFKTMIMAIFETKENGRSSLMNPPDLFTRVGVRIRGSSTAGWPKYSMRLESWDEYDEDKNIRPFGMPSEADWVMSGRYDFDRALIRNPFMYALSNQIDRYAVRTQFVEVIHDTDNDGNLAFSDYFGVYAFMEQLKRDANRIDIAELTPGDNAPPEITGGYMLRIDRNDPDGAGFTGGGQDLKYNEPKSDEITQAQKDYIRDYCNQMAASLSSSDPETGYPAFIDAGAWIDEHIMRTLTKDPDGLRLSTNLFKDRGGKLAFGPIWDFDRTMGCDSDGRAFDPRSWAPADYFFTHTWWNTLIGNSARNQGPGANPDFWQAYKDRWHELRQGALSVENMNALADELAAQIREAQVRNFQRWPNQPNGGQFAGGVPGWEGEVEHMKGWLEARVLWIDDQFLGVPVFNQNGGAVAEGFPLAMSSIDGPVWYTIDGSDPRARGGAPSATAIQFPGGPIDNTYLESEVPCKYLVPLDDALGLTWTAKDFDDAAWPDGVTGLGWETSGPLLDIINTNLSAEARGINASVYLRFEFDFNNNPANINSVNLKMKYDDGFVAYINGVEVASGNKPANLAWNSAASASHPDTQAQRFEDNDISAFKSAFVEGTNVLAIQAMNSTIGGSDMFILPELEINETVVPEPIGLSESTFVTARTFNGTIWSAPARANFVVGADLADASNLAITEIMYRPGQESPAEAAAGFTDRDEFEYIELMNIGSNTIDMRDVAFTGGLDFQFATSAIGSLDPGERLLVVRNQAAFTLRYGQALSSRIAGEFANGTQLNNDGEALLLQGADGATIRSFTFNDVPPWPQAANGSGASLVLINPQDNPDHSLPGNWRSSAPANGKPGVSDSIAFSGDPLADSDNDRVSKFLEHALGSSDNDAASGSGLTAPGMGSFVIGQGEEEFMTYSYRRNLAADDVEFTVEASANLTTWQSGSGVVELVGETHNGDGTATVTYRMAEPVSAGGGNPQFMRLRVTAR